MNFLFERCGGRGTTRAEVAQGTPTQSHISPNIPVYEDNSVIVLTNSIVVLTNSVIVLTNSDLVRTNSFMMLTNSVIVLTQTVSVLSNSVIPSTGAIRAGGRDGLELSDTPVYEP
jgi:hypothetical protein